MRYHKKYDFKPGRLAYNIYDTDGHTIIMQW